MRPPQAIERTEFEQLVIVLCASIQGQILPSFHFFVRKEIFGDIQRWKIH